MGTQVLEVGSKTELTLYSRSLDLDSPDWLAISGASVRWTTISQLIHISLCRSRDPRQDL